MSSCLQQYQNTSNKDLMSNILNIQISKGKIHLPHVILFNDSYFRSNRGTKWFDDLKKGEDLGDSIH